MTDNITIPPGRADIIIINADVYTADMNNPRCAAVAVKGGKVLAAGKNDEILALAGDNTRVIDSNGGALVPGMVDAHMHPMSGARRRLHSINLTPEMDKCDYYKEIARHIEENPDKPHYTGGGLMPEIYDCCGPNKGELDAICTDKPIVILSYDGHTTWVNSKALEVMNITKDTPDPENGVIHRDPVTGEPTGYLAGSAGACAGGLMRGFMPRYGLEENTKSVLYTQEMLMSKGVTSVYDAHIDPDPGYYMAYENLAREGKLNITVRGAWFIPRDMGSEEDISTLIDRCIALSKEFRTDRFQVNGFKFLCDQVCEAETAYMCQPYCDRCDGWRGLRVWEDGEMLARLFAKIDAAGFQIHLHQIGDGAAEYALDALEAAARINGGLKMRHTFAHCQFIADEDKKRMAKLGVNALVAPYWMNTTILSTLDIPHLGEQRACSQYPVGSLMRSGVNVAVHSDYAVSMPDWCDALYGLRLRCLSPKGFDVFYRRIEGAEYTLDPDAPFAEHICAPMPCPEECICAEAAVEVMTANGAKTMDIDGITGRIAPGMRADMALLNMGPDGFEKKNVCVRLTMCGGEVFEN